MICATFSDMRNFFSRLFKRRLRDPQMRFANPAGGGGEGGPKKTGALGGIGFVIVEYQTNGIKTFCAVGPGGGGGGPGGYSSSDLEKLKKVEAEIECLRTRVKELEDELRSLTGGDTSMLRGDCVLPAAHTGPCRDKDGLEFEI